jgi:hypothetical protein
MQNSARGRAGHQAESGQARIPGHLPALLCRRSFLVIRWLLRAAFTRDRRRYKMRGQFITGSEAAITKKQHRVPCSDCPFARRSLAGWVGLVTPMEWIMLAHGEGTADCHAKRGTNRAWACAGLAIYRANVAKLPRDPKIMRLPPDPVLVFSSMIEFLAHHDPPKEATNWNEKASCRIVSDRRLCFHCF